MFETELFHEACKFIIPPLCLRFCATATTNNASLRTLQLAKRFLDRSDQMRGRIDSRKTWIPGRASEMASQLATHHQRFEMELSV